MKVIFDPIYGQIQVSGLCAAFIRTGEFQRLRRIMQLGNTSEVFPSGVLTRAEHSIGVMHICGVIFNNMVNNSPGREKLIKYLPLIQLSGLLHDIGHGPKSHLFEEARKIMGMPFSHEEHSIYLIERINQRLNLLNEEQMEIITCMILGKKIEGYPPCLFEIVANKDSGLDGDKMDYLQRDAYHLGITSIDVEPIIKNCCIDDDGHITYSEAIKENIRELFKFRKLMYAKVYFDETVAKIDRMWICAICQLEIDTEDPDAFFKLDDSVLYYRIKNEIQHDVIKCLDNGITSHSCEKCPKSPLKRVAKLSSDTDDDPVYHVRFYEENPIQKLKATDAIYFQEKNIK